MPRPPVGADSASPAQPERAPHVHRRLERTRARLVAAAEELLGEAPVARLTVTAVTDRAGLRSRKTFYSHFPDGVCGLLRALIAARREEMREVIRPAPGEPAEDYLRRSAMGVLDTWRGRAPVWRATLHLDQLGPQGAALEREWSAVLRSWAEVMSARVREAHTERGTPAPANLEARVGAWLTGAGFVLSRLLSSPEHTPAEEAATAAALVDTLVAACGLEHTTAAPAG
ncbi:TetR/AcrR family transcriptional regulator [Streptomonospora nanhaiensis]|uniref:AcrR family transcriptional regulator n=1 Tax=Streptomonospora nanhaiensis TaxID=1323731 RepID=A0A853BRP0_9ACTN|nr:TetR/AcrR family transcriptional regulator [Streptomonospora nanhaiensis]MBV2366993.1 TetR/AcrR family transcriptional regulator [Streptomonospora nanhaiensis]MBX9390152.1 TetR/AcrR family transcriptional regulator [Streptomonospora nanhaiensis]NYI97161.1 AcrR family transcriptional regulator [Streptomonospora nanhaiensis]